MMMAVDAGTYFQQAAWQRIVPMMHVKYKHYGLRGTISLPTPTRDEVDAVARLFGDQFRVPSPGAPLQISMAKLDAVLRSTRFACGIAEVLAAVFQQEITPRSEMRRLAAAAWDDFVDRVEVAAPRGTRPEQWLAALRGRQPVSGYIQGLVSRGEEEKAFRLATLMLHALAELPTDYGRCELLGVFANRLSGDPHAFDGGTVGGSLLMRILISHTDRTLTSSRAHFRQVLEEAGLLLDTISSTTTVCGLRGATLASGDPDPTILPARVRTLNLGELQKWQAVHTSRNVFVVENPNAFEALASVRSSATLICTNGFLSQASARLLDLVAGSGAILHYSGDFDRNGLKIAQLLLGRYHGQIHLWMMDGAAYNRAVAVRPGRRLKNVELAWIEQMAESWPTLASAMARHKVTAYQEGLVGAFQEAFPVANTNERTV